MEEAAEPPEAILEREERMDSMARVAWVRGWEGLDLWRVREVVVVCWIVVVFDCRIVVAIVG